MPATAQTINHQVSTQQNLSQPKEQYAKPASQKQSPKILTKPLSISISGNNQQSSGSQNHTQTAPTDNTLTIQHSELVKPEQFRAIWAQFGNTLSDEQLVAFRNLNEPVCLNEQEYEIVVSNNMQESDAKKLLTDAIQFLRYNLRNSNINIKTRIEEDTILRRSLSPEQIYQEMAARNPFLEEFRKIMKLEID